MTQDRLDAALQRIYDNIPTDEHGRKLYNPDGHRVERLDELPIFKENDHDTHADDAAAALREPRERADADKR